MTEPISPARFYAKTSKTAATPKRAANRPIAPMDTPIHGRLSATQPCTSTAEYKDPVFVAAADELKGKYVCVEPLAFLKVFLPHVDGMPSVDFPSFAEVADKSTEPQMYDPLISALAPFLQQGMMLVNTSNTPDPDSAVFLDREVKPDISCYSKPAPQNSCITRASDMELFLELKNHAQDEPFDDGASEFERDTAHGRDTRGQLVTYLNAIQALQNRSHIFAVFINKDRCRLIHHSRSCSIVTKAFDYTDTNILQTFFWRFTHAPAAVRGHDTTMSFIELETKETKAARVKLKLGNECPLYMVSVEDFRTEQVLYYIISTPFTDTHAYPVGRGTRCYKAYDCATGKLVLMKDSWRVEGYEPDSVIYQRLYDKQSLQCCGWFNDRLKATRIGKSIRRHAHYRLVLGTIGVPISRFPSTWIMVNAIYCALIAHEMAFKLAKILHRDISVGNILILPNGKGVLIDWELSKDLDQNVPRTYERTGTSWQFLSVRLMNARAKNLPAIHDVGDDLESFVHVMVWLAARYAPNNMDPSVRGAFLAIFDAPAGVDFKETRMTLGKEAIERLLLGQRHLETLLEDLWFAFGRRYASYRDIEAKNDGLESETGSESDSSDWWDQSLIDETRGEFGRRNLQAVGAEGQGQPTQDTSPSQREADLALITSHDWIIATMRTALANQVWMGTKDKSVKHQLPESGKSYTEGQKKRKSMLTEYNVDAKDDANYTQETKRRRGVSRVPP
ncbi:hypothetical protein BDZ89DRAFT_1069580 [Hymenopellis radicata]|nr:hypothetical protein BDZ89DRAFT_1069580 [Hymenopellis radicata]